MVNFGYPYNDLVICKDSTDYLSFSVTYLGGRYVSRLCMLFLLRIWTLENYQGTGLWLTLHQFSRKATEFWLKTTDQFLCILFEHIVCRHILDHVEDHKILTNLQHGFRSGRSCETQLITTTHELLSSFNSKSQIDVAILDFWNREEIDFMELEYL